MSTIICLGIAVQDLILSVDAIPGGPGKTRARGMAMAGGGMAASAAVAIARLGGRAELWTRLGDDAVGDAIVDELERYGVGTAGCARLAGCSSSISAVLVDAEGERLIVNHVDAALDDDPAWLPLLEVADAGAVLADTRWTTGALALFEAAGEHGIPAVLDADSAPEDPRLVDRATHAVFSSDALRAFTGCLDAVEGLRAVSARAAGAGSGATPGRMLAVTGGAEGVRWLAGGELGHLPAFEVEVVDTLGAGDVFHGACALALAEGQEVRDAMRFAAAAAALKCTRFGGRAGTPARDEVERLLGRTGIGLRATRER